VIETESAKFFPRVVRGLESFVRRICYDKQQQFGRMCALLAVAMLTATTQVSGQDATTAALRNAARSIAAGNLESAERELRPCCATGPGTIALSI
jgi:hypothetical protein